VRYDETESAAALAQALLQDIDVPKDRIDALVRNVRDNLSPRTKPRQRSEATEDVAI
jgi:hypothetical protein